MFYILVLIAIIMGILYEKSRLVSIFQLFVIWILFGWSYGNADYSNYFIRYTNYDSIALGERTEYLFFQLFKLGNKLELSYDQFLIVISLIFVVSLGIIIRRLSLNPNLVLSLYLVFPACIDATQFRFALASIFILFGFLVLFDENVRFGEFYFAALVVVAALFHIGTILFLFMLPVRRLNKKKTYFYTFIGCVTIMVLGMGGAEKILSLFPGMQMKLSLMSTSSIETLIYWIIMEIVVWIIFLMVLYLFKKNSLDFGGLKNYNYIHRVVIISAIIIPITLFFQDAYRILQCVCILLYCSLSNVFPTGIIAKMKRGIFTTKGTKSTLLILCFGFAFLLLYAIVLNSSNFETVFIPYFEENRFLNF